MTKKQRQYFDIISSYGCEIVSSRCNKHFVIKFRSQDGRVHTVAAAVTPSDWRAAKNFTSTIAKLIGA